MVADLSLVVIVVCWVSDSSGIGKGGCGPVTGGGCCSWNGECGIFCGASKGVRLLCVDVNVESIMTVEIDKCFQR